MNMRRRGSRRTVGAFAIWAALLACLVVTPAQALDCQVEIRRPVAFGTYEPARTNRLRATGRVRVTCTGTPGAYVMTLGPGLGADMLNRAMKKGTESLFYNLYVDSARTTIWGDGTGATTTISGSKTRGGRQRVTHRVYGEIPPNQDPEPGDYADSILVTVVF